MLGAVELDVDWRVPLDDLRIELDRALRASEIWDERVGILQVTDAVGSSVRVRALVSGVDGPTVFDLRCEVREALVGFLQREHPDALPRIRVENSAPGVPGRAGTAPPDRPADDTLPVSRPRARRSSGESESESTHSQGLFTGSIQAIERARGFTGSGPQQPDHRAPDGSGDRT